MSIWDVTNVLFDEWDPSSPVYLALLLSGTGLLQMAATSLAKNSLCKQSSKQKPYGRIVNISLTTRRLLSTELLMI